MAAHLANLIVVGVMAWRDLQSTGAKLPVHILVCNDGDPPAREVVATLLTPSGVSCMHHLCQHPCELPP